MHRGHKQLDFSKQIEEELLANNENIFDSNGLSISKLWKAILQPFEEFTTADKLNLWYNLGKEYWEVIPSTVDGVLGGLSSVNEKDIKESSDFIDFIRENYHYSGEKDQETRVIDVAAGIGRVSQYLLLHHFTKVDLLEQNINFINEAKNNIILKDKIENYICAGMQDRDCLIPDIYYDAVWISWAIGTVCDCDFVYFLKRCKKQLKENGVIYIKDNTTSKSAFFYDDVGHSIARSVAYTEYLFKEAGFKVLHKTKQIDWDDDLLPVWIWALIKEGENQRGEDEEISGQQKQEVVVDKDIDISNEINNNI